MNLSMILKNGGPEPFMRALAFLNGAEYRTVENFLKSISNDDLKYLMRCVLDVQNGDLGESLRWICCLADAVALKEGLPIDEPEVYRVQHLMVVLTFENLCRTGDIIFNRSLASLDKMTDFEKVASIKK